MKMQHYLRIAEQVDDMRQAVERLNAAATSLSARRAWEHMLEAMARTYHKAAAASRGDSRAEAWVRQILAERKSDPLLIYLHQARHSAEHGIEDVATGLGPLIFNVDQIQNREFSISRTIQFRGDRTVETEVTSMKGLRPGIDVVLNSVGPVPVRNRGITYPVPTAHLDERVNGYCSEISAFALKYMEARLKEAKEFVDQASA